MFDMAAHAVNTTDLDLGQPRALKNKVGFFDNWKLLAQLVFSFPTFLCRLQWKPTIGVPTVCVFEFG